MKCTACGTEVVDTSVFCHRCGARLDLQGPALTNASDPPAGDVPETQTSEADQVVSSRVRAAVGPAGQADEDIERDLWQGGYCGKAMMGTWIVSSLATMALAIAAILLGNRPIVWWTVVVAVVLLWGYEFVVFAGRRLGVHYRLTSQRFFHEKGILVHTTDLIEVIDMDDITFSQTLVDRVFGVGTIRIVSSDRSHPDLSIHGIADVKNVAAKMHEARHTERVRRGLHIESI
jgi:membrane protein YdbS with pleckstrin-like domain